jgi:hypothetical protein
MMITDDIAPPSDTDAALAELNAAYHQALSELPDWQRDEAAETLDALRGTLPGLAGHIDEARVRRMIAVFVPSDVVGVHEAARIAGRSPQRIRQLCRSRYIGHFDAQRRRYRVSRRLLDEYMTTKRRPV